MGSQGSLHFAWAASNTDHSQIFSLDPTTHRYLAALETSVKNFFSRSGLRSEDPWQDQGRLNLPRCRLTEPCSTAPSNSAQAGGSFVHNGAGRLELAPRAPHVFGKVGRRFYPLRVGRAPGIISARANVATGETETTNKVAYTGDSDFGFSGRFDKKSSSVGIRRISTIKPRVIVIAGPTAVGKTRLSIELAKSLGGEIINADSVQVYQGMDVGAAKVSVEEREGIPHHLLDMVPPTVEYTYEQFYMDARAATNQIIAKGLVPIVVGGTGMYMRWYMHNSKGITSHPFDGEDVTGEFAGGHADWDFDFQCYFLYQHRADLFQRVDIRCEQMVPALLEETSWLLDMGVTPDSNSAAKAIGYEEAMALLLTARENEGFITDEEFLDFLTDFQNNSKDLVRKQIKWFRNPKRSEVRLFRWTDATHPVDEMVRAVISEYYRPPGQPMELTGGDILKAASLKEQKRLKGYSPTLKMFSCLEARSHILEWVRRTQGPQSHHQ